MAVKHVAVAAEAAFLAAITWTDWQHGWPLQETLSQQVHGPAGAWLTAGFIAHALSLGTLAQGRRSLQVAAVGMLLVTAFPVGEAPWESAIHVAGAFMAFGGIAVAAWIHRQDVPFVPWAGVVVLGTAAMALALVLDGGLGVLERAQAWINGAWIFLAAPVFSSSPKSARP